MIVPKFRIFTISDIVQELHKHAMQKVGVLSVFEKINAEKRKKKSFSVFRTAWSTQNLSFAFFFWNMLVWVQNSFCGWEKGILILGKFLKRKENCVVRVFWRKFYFSLIRYTKFYTSNKKRIFWKFDDIILLNCRNLFLLPFFHRLCIWSCMLSIFGLWVSPG